MAGELNARPGAAPLAGIRIVDLTQVAAGPYATSLLGDFGADVIKVEPPGGEPFRSVDTLYGEGNSAYFYGLNRSKRAVVVDLKTEAGREVFERLVETADVVIVSMRPQASRALGVDYETLRERHPALVYCSITAFGEDGPLAAMPGMDILVQALGGLMGTTGEPGRTPVKAGPPVSDFATSYLACFAILAALRVRDTSGEGQKISLSLLDATVSMMANYITPFLRSGVPIRPVGAGHPQIVPYQAFAASDGWIVVACLLPRFWLSLCRTIGREDLVTDPRFQANVDRVDNRAALTEILSEIFAGDTVAAWEKRLRAADVPSARINRLEDVVVDEQVVHNGMMTTIRHPEHGDIPVVGNPLKLSATPARPGRYPPSVGEHTDEVLQSLGYSPEQITGLRDAKAIG